MNPDAPPFSPSFFSNRVLSNRGLEGTGGGVRAGAYHGECGRRLPSDAPGVALTQLVASRAIEAMAATSTAAVAASAAASAAAAPPTAPPAAPTEIRKKKFDYDRLRTRWLDHVRGVSSTSCSDEEEVSDCCCFAAR